MKNAPKAARGKERPPPVSKPGKGHNKGLTTQDPRYASPRDPTTPKKKNPASDKRGQHWITIGGMKKLVAYRQDPKRQIPIDEMRFAKAFALVKACWSPYPDLSTPDLQGFMTRQGL